MTKAIHVDLPKVIGKGYGEFWRSKHRYRVVKGSRASKKSTTTALNYIIRMMQNPEANLLVIRKTFRTLKDSCFADLRWAVKRLKVDHLWDFKVSPLEAVYKPTGQLIYFRGLDDPLKIASISVPEGYLCWLWLEEAYEVLSEADFDTLDESIRGEMPNGLYKQITLTLNPWNERHWIKRRFFDHPSDDVLALTTTYKCNEWLDDADLRLFEDMRVRNPRRYAVAGLGNWGVVEGLVYENWRESHFTKDDLPKDAVRVVGLDFGYTADPTAIVLMYYSQSERQIYIADEIYQRGLSNQKIASAIKDHGLAFDTIIADSAEPKSIAELNRSGLRVSGAWKGKGSVQTGIQWLQDQEIIISPKCINFATEISNYSFKKDKFDNLTNDPVEDHDHLMDAMRYGMERFILAGRDRDTRAQVQALRRLGL